MSHLLTRRRRAVILGVYFVAFVIVALWAPLVGVKALDYGAVARQLFQGPMGTDAQILLYHRIPRVVLGLLVGGGLALAGASFQVVLRNPLAEPFTLGATGGSAVGAVIAISVPTLSFSWWVFSSTQVLAMVGALMTLGLIYALSRRPTGISMGTLLLTGVTMSILCGGLIMLARYLVSPNLLVQMDRWMMGGLDVVGFEGLASLLPLLLPAVGLLFLQGVSLNHLSFGREMAAGHGVDVSAVQKQVFIGGGLATAAVVSVAGPIGFVGLIIPHAVRRLSGYDHRVVLPASFLLGGAFLVACDVLARTVLAPTEMPVGVITALIGGPVFLAILLKRKG